MPHDAPLVATLVIGLVLAFILGAAAHRLKLSPVAGYLLAGIVIGPFTPGMVADPKIASQLADVGVILLMFGVGLHFSPKELLAARSAVLPGALLQIAILTLLGMGVAMALGWGVGAGLVFGLALSVASTVVMLRELGERRLLDSERGRVAVGWLVVEDLATVFALVLLPPAAQILLGESVPPPQVAWAIVVAVAKLAGFVLLALIVGRRLIPQLLHAVAHSGSRELFRLAVLAIALGVAYGAALLFDVSIALGAFFAGMILSESQLSQRAAQETLPLRDAFAVLFFVSVGMLFNPAVLTENPGALAATVGLVLVGNSLSGWAILRLFGHSQATAVTVAAGLAQIGEFSFILAALGVSLGLLPAEGRDLILAAAFLSILLNPVLFSWAERLAPKLEEPPRPSVPSRRVAHAVVAGYGGVGERIAAGLVAEGAPFLVIEDQPHLVEQLRQAGFEAIAGNAVRPETLAQARLGEARCLFVTIPQAFEAGQVVEQARRLNPTLPILARAGGEAEIAHFRSVGATGGISAEQAIAAAMLAEARRTPHRSSS